MTKKNSKQPSGASKKTKARGRSANTVAAQRESVASKTVPVAYAQRNLKSMFSSRSASDGKNDYAVVRCSDRLGAVTILGASPNIPEGRVLFVQDLNPRRFGNTALEVEAALWDRFRLKKITFTYCTTVATSTSGSVVGGFDPDVQDQAGYILGSDVTLRKFCAHRTVAQTSLYRNMSWSYSAPPDLPFLYTRDTAQNDAGDGTSHWSSPGVFALLSNVPFTTDVGTVGVIWYDAEYEFNQRNVEGAIQDAGFFQYTNDGSSGASTPFVGVSTFAYQASTISTTPLPIKVDNQTVDFTDLDADKAYIARFYWPGGTTCSVAPTIATAGSIGTLIDSSASFSASACAALGLFRPNAAGKLRIRVNQGTWATYPTTGNWFLTSLPSGNTNVLT
jgi:hypothetical protein